MIWNIYCYIFIYDICTLFYDHLVTYICAIIVQLDKLLLIHTHIYQNVDNLYEVIPLLLDTSGKLTIFYYVTVFPMVVLSFSGKLRLPQQTQHFMWLKMDLKGKPTWLLFIYSMICIHLLIFIYLCIHS